MKIRHIKIERFRGIQGLEWRVGGDFVCLVGPARFDAPLKTGVCSGQGVSTKTTILDAVEFALSPRWNIPFDDSDFYDTNTSAPILITVTVGELPEEFRSPSTHSGIPGFAQGRRVGARKTAGS